MPGKPWLRRKGGLSRDAKEYAEDVGLRHLERQHGPDIYRTATKKQAAEAYNDRQKQLQEQAAHPSSAFAHHPPTEED